MIGEMNMFKIKKDIECKPISLFISDKEFELHYCQCHDVCYGICKLEDLKSESGIDFPDEIHLATIDDDNICTRIEIQKIDSGKKLKVEYLFHKNAPEPPIGYTGFALFNLYFSSPEALEIFQKHYTVELNENYILLSKKIKLSDSIYQSINRDLINFKKFLQRLF